MAVDKDLLYRRVGACSCPSCNHRYTYQEKDGKMVWAFDLEIDERDYGADCKELADGILQCGVCGEPFKVLFDLEKTSRKLTQAERMKYYKKEWDRDVEELGQKTIDKYSTISIVDFDKEKGTVLVKDAKGNRQKLNVLELIINNFMLECLPSQSSISKLSEAKEYIADVQAREAYNAKVAKREQTEKELKADQKQK